MELQEAFDRANRAQQAINDMGFGPPSRQERRNVEISKSRLRNERKPKDLTFAAALRQARESVKLSQGRLAARAGYDHSYVSRLESDSRAPTRDAVLSLSKAMGLDAVSCDYLLAAAGFLPLNVENLLASEPVASEIYAVLNDGSLPVDVRDDLRSAVRMAIRQAQRAVTS